MSRAQASKTPSPAAASALWGATLPIPAGPGSGDHFEARVEAAWRHLKAAYFGAEEHGRLRGVLAARIEAESIASAQPDNKCLD